MKSLIVSTICCTLCTSPSVASDTPWKRHTIDNSSRGADGIRTADINGDDLLDLTTGWEEGGVIRVYLNPGPEKSKESWPAVTVGKVKSPEDAVFVDLDSDGNIDIVSCCEGKVQSVFVHWAPPAERMLEESAWKTEAIPVLANKTRWMFCLPQEIDGRRGMDLVLGSKAPNAVVGWLQAPVENPRNLAEWKWHELYQAGWIMSILPLNGPGDGHSAANNVDPFGTSFLVTDRKGPTRGLYLFEHPGFAAAQRNEKWNIQRLGGDDHEVMFIDHLAIPPPGWEILVSTRDNGILGFAQNDSPTPPGVTSAKYQLSGSIPAATNTGTLKSVRWCNVDLNDQLDVIYSCENANGDKSGVVWLKQIETAAGVQWQRNEISGPEGVKFDLVQLIDLDSDGDLDVLTCEERENLGVIWYENPTR